MTTACFFLQLVVAEQLGKDAPATTEEKSANELAKELLGKSSEHEAV
ncbi:hypothetical protein HY357_02550 [Candidatus Roizmanbacteria bacterium]|nr:hypothetical protein [Candidatus Roizmanbacteria bacterium]